MRITHTTYDCSRTVPHTFNADAVPTVALRATEDICVGGYFELTATPTPAEAPHEGAYTYTWYRGGTALDGVSGPTFSDGPMAVGTYNYGVSVKSTYPGCESAVDEIPGMEVHEKPVIEIAGNTVYCEVPANVILEAQGEHASSTYQWYVDEVAINPGGSKSN